MVMQMIIEICICSIDNTQCSVDKLCLECKKYKYYELKEENKKYRWRF